MVKKKKLTYSIDVLNALRLVKSKFEKAGLELDTRYIDYFGECPRCGDTFKIYRQEVKDAATVSAFLNMEQQKGIAYCLCKKCVKEEMSTFTANRDAEITEKRIFEKIPDLSRTKKLTRAEIQMEKRLLKKIYGF